MVVGEPKHQPLSMFMAAASKEDIASQGKKQPYSLATDGSNDGGF
jgi:hypothetical protein